MSVDQSVPFVDVVWQYQQLRDELDRAAIDVIGSGRYVLGETVASFERDFAAMCGASHAIGVNSGTSALHLALLAAGIGPEDEVIVPAMTFIATAAAVSYTGARPVFVDVEADTWTLDPTLVEAAITLRTKAIIPVHLYGQSADLAPLLAIARAHRLVLIEDAAQAHGARYRDRPVGGQGDLGCFSFYPSKNLGACGEGGMVVTNNPEFAENVQLRRDWAQPRKGTHQVIGYNMRLDALQAALLHVKLPRLEEWNDWRRRAAVRYADLLADCPGIQLPHERADGRHVYHLYAVLTPHRDALRAALNERGIQSGVHYPVPLHLQPCFAELGYQRGDFPRAERLGDEELSLPIHPGLADEQVQRVSSTVREVAATLAKGV